jgi:hypothetical protein
MSNAASGTEMPEMTKAILGKAISGILSISTPWFWLRK